MLLMTSTDTLAFDNKVDGGMEYSWAMNLPLLCLSREKYNSEQLMEILMDMLTLALKSNGTRESASDCSSAKH